MSKIVAIDFGLKRTGLAITDSNAIIASPLTTVDSRTLMDFLSQLTNKESISTMVLGYPTRLDGSDTHITENVRLLKEALAKQFPHLSESDLEDIMKNKSNNRSNYNSRHNEDKEDNNTIQVLYFNYKTYSQTKEVEIYLFNNTEYALSFNGKSCPKPVKVKIYKFLSSQLFSPKHQKQENYGHKLRKLMLFSRLYSEFQKWT